MKREIHTDLGAHALLFLVYMVLFATTSFIGALLLPKYAGLIIGVILMLAAIPFQLISNRRHGALAAVIILNCCGTGFLVSSYYTWLQIELKLVEALTPALAVSLLFLVLCVVLKRHKDRASFVLMLFSMIGIGAAVFMAVMWARTLGAIYSFGFFSTCVMLINMLVLCFSFGDKGRNGVEDFALGSFGIIAVIAIAVLVAIAVFADGDCDCDLGDCDCAADCCCDLDCFDRARNRKSSRKSK